MADPAQELSPEEWLAAHRAKQGQQSTAVAPPAAPAAPAGPDPMTGGPAAPSSDDPEAWLAAKRAGGTTGAASPGRGGQWQGTAATKAKTPPSQGQQFVGTLGEGLWNIPAGIAKTAMAVLGMDQSGTQARSELMQNIAGASKAQFDKAAEYEKQGNPTMAQAYRTAGGIPVIGPAAAEVGENILHGEYGKAAANAILLGGPEAWNRLAPKTAKIKYGPKNVNNPVVDEAMGDLSKTVRMTPYQRTGKIGSEKSARNLTNLPATDTEAINFYQGQEGDLAAEAERRVQQQGSQGPLPSYSGRPMLTDELDDVAAGKFIQDEVESTTRHRQRDADREYDYVRQQAAKNIRTVQTGTEDVETPVPGFAIGKKSTVPVFDVMETPVPLDPVRADLQSVYDDLSQNLPPAQKERNPAYTALKNLMESDKTHMPAMEFDKFIGAVKHITRNGTSNVLSDVSQALALKVINAGEKQLELALTGAGQDVMDSLQRGRAAVKDYHTAARFLDDIRKRPNEPFEDANIYRSFLRPKNASYNALQMLKGYSPAAVDTIGRANLEEMMRIATTDGGFSKSAKIRNAWLNLGDKTKNLIYGPEVVKSIDRLLLGSQRLALVEGSATAARALSWLGYHDIGKALSEVFLGGIGGAMTGHPWTGFVGGAGVAANHMLATRVFPSILARIAFKPAGANLLNMALTLPINTPAFNRAMTALEAMATSEKQKVPPPRKQPVKPTTQAPPPKVSFSDPLSLFQRMR